MTDLASPQKGAIARWLYEPEIDIYRNVRLFCIVAFAAVILHFVTDAMEERHFNWFIVLSMRVLEFVLFLGDVIGFLLKLIVRFIIQLRELLQLLKDNFKKPAPPGDPQESEPPSAGTSKQA